MPYWKDKGRRNAATEISSLHMVYRLPTGSTQRQGLDRTYTKQGLGSVVHQNRQYVYVQSRPRGEGLRALTGVRDRLALEVQVTYYSVKI